ncbi:hypothetical protein AALO_G00072210 [Alosa alosa]|uniref:B30.2/SPRY domain-containing protein n=1 Tax=Alosa alosa TaxID=278164 RepID=A0AAV6H272_9TELE|nr:hypothetical protein AALO_G00072210 [Alosa alosa]
MMGETQMSDVQAVFTEPVTREEFLKYSCHFTLDPNTAHRLLHLSEGNRRVEYRAELQSYPDHPERFDEQYQVLCREGVSGRCYWEVEWSGRGSSSPVGLTAQGCAQGSPSPSDERTVSTSSSTTARTPRAPWLLFPSSSLAHRKQENPHV